MSRCNPTPTIYQCFHDRADPTDHVVRLLDERRVTAVAIASWAVFPWPLDQRPRPVLREGYPDSATVWHDTVRWRSADRLSRTR
jgi:hypothetical protein